MVSYRGCSSLLPGAIYIFSLDNEGSPKWSPELVGPPCPCEMGTSCRFCWWQGFLWALKADLQPKMEHLERWTNIVPAFSPFSLKLFLEEGVHRLRQVQWHWAENVGCGKEGELFAFTPQASEQTGVQWLTHLTLLMMPFLKNSAARWASLKHSHMDDTGSRTGAEIMNWMPSF